MKNTKLDPVAIEHRFTRLEFLVSANIVLTFVWGGKDFIFKLIN